MTDLFSSMRLACRYCDRDDCDGVVKPPRGWVDVGEARPLNDGGEAIDWYTHIGICPECKKENLKR